MKKQPNLTRKQHAEFGAFLSTFRNTLITRFIHVWNAYPKASRATRHLIRLEHDIDMLKCHLDDLAAEELGDDFSVQLYYPIKKCK